MICMIGLFSTSFCSLTNMLIFMVQRPNRFRGIDTLRTFLEYFLVVVCLVIDAIPIFRSFAKRLASLEMLIGVGM